MSIIKNQFKKIQKPYSLFRRTIKPGSHIYYYRVFNDSGKIIAQRSTGQTNKAAAEAYCAQPLKKDLLIPGEPERPPLLFKDFAENWFIYDKCEYIQRRLERDFTFSKSYADIQRLNLKNHILPAFGKKKLLILQKK